MTIKIDYKEDSEIIHDLEEILAGANNIFVMPEIMNEVEGVLKTVSNRAGREDFISKITLLPLPNLLYHLVNKNSQVLPSGTSEKSFHIIKNPMITIQTLKTRTLIQ